MTSLHESQKNGIRQQPNQHLMDKTCQVRKELKSNECMYYTQKSTRKPHCRRSNFFFVVAKCILYVCFKARLHMRFLSQMYVNVSFSITLISWSENRLIFKTSRFTSKVTASWDKREKKLWFHYKNGEVYSWKPPESHPDILTNCQRSGKMCSLYRVLSHTFYCYWAEEYGSLYRGLRFIGVPQW